MIWSRRLVRELCLLMPQSDQDPQVSRRRSGYRRDAIDLRDGGIDVAAGVAEADLLIAK
jgi:hypothetical protein